MTQSVASSRRKPSRDVFDLALLEAVRANVLAARELLRANAALKAAVFTGNDVRRSDARHAVNNASAKVAVAKSNLDAAIQIEAESRA